jgi:hypothetical protein
MPLAPASPRPSIWTNARILAERFLPFGYDTATVDTSGTRRATSSWYRAFAPLVLDAHGRPQPGRQATRDLYA